MEINSKLFVSDENGNARITDPSRETHADLFRAAETCPSAAIHPGVPIDKREELAKWLERAAPFNEDITLDEWDREEMTAWTAGWEVSGAEQERGQNRPSMMPEFGRRLCQSFLWMF